MNHLIFSFILCAAACALGTLANTLGPHRIPWSQNWSDQVLEKAEASGVPIVDADRARDIVKEGGRMILDARSKEDYDAGHLPGALSLPLKTFEDSFPEVQGLIFPEDPLLVYCSGLSCDEALELAKRLKEMNFENIDVFAGGMEAWKDAGHPIE